MSRRDYDEGAAAYVQRTVRESEKSMKAWEVLQNGTVVCSYKMALTRSQALNKIENEERMKKSFSSWSIRQSKYAICPSCLCAKDEDGCGCNPEGA